MMLAAPRRKPRKLNEGDLEEKGTRPNNPPEVLCSARYYRRPRQKLAHSLTSPVENMCKLVVWNEGLKEPCDQVASRAPASDRNPDGSLKTDWLSFGDSYRHAPRQLSDKNKNSTKSPLHS